MKNLIKKSKLRQTHRFQNHFGKDFPNIWNDNYQLKITKRCDSIHAKPVRALDLRGNEQVCSRLEAEQYAGLLGYRKFYFGHGDSPLEVGHDIFQLDFKNNRLLSQEQLDKLDKQGILGVIE